MGLYDLYASRVNQGTSQDVYQLAQFIIFQSVVTFQMDLQVIYMFHTKEKGRE